MRFRGRKYLAAAIGLLVYANFSQASDDASGSAAAVVARAGGEIVRDHDKPDNPIYGIRLEGKHFDDQLVNAIAAIPHLQVLLIRGSEITDAQFSQLGDLSDLERIDLGGTKLTSRSILRLGKCRHLKMISLISLNLNDATFSELSGLKSLEFLDLSGNEIGANVLAWICQQSQLTELGLGALSVIFRDCLASII